MAMKNIRRAVMLTAVASLSLGLPVGMASADPAPANGDGCVIAIDPGHNPTQISPVDQKTGIKMVDYPNGKEDADVFAVSQDVKTQLEAAGYKVVLLKDSVQDSESYRDRVTKAEQAEAKLAISIHTSPGASEVYPQVVGAWRAKAPGSSEKVTFNNQATADASKKAADIFAKNRQAAEGTAVTVKSPDFSGRDNLAAGNIPNIQLLAENTPWVYNELGVTGGGGANGITEAQKKSYANGIVASVKEAVKCGTPPGSTAPESSNPPSATPSATAPAPSATKPSNPPSATPSATAPAPSSGTPATGSEELADPAAKELFDKVNSLMKDIGIPEQVVVNGPGRAHQVYEEIKACGDKSKDDCESKGGTVKNAGNFYRLDATKIAAISYELALTKTNFLSEDRRSGPFLVRDQGSDDIVFKDKDGMNPREQVSEKYEEYVEGKKKDDKYPSTAELLKKVRTIKYEGSEQEVSFYPVVDRNGTTAGAGKWDKDDNFRDRKEINPSSYLQQAAVIVLSEGRFEKYSQLKAAAEAKKRIPANDAPVSEQETATEPLDATKLEFADGYKLKRTQAFIDLRSEFTVVGDEWNIRELPDVESKSIGKASTGDKFRIVGFDDGSKTLQNAVKMTGTAISKEYQWPDSNGKMHTGTGWVYIVLPNTNKVAYIAYPYQLHQK